MRILTVLAVVAACSFAGHAGAETLDNGKVAALVQVGLGDEAVIAKVRNSAARYDTSTDGLIALRKAGISSAVIAAMIEAAQASDVSADAVRSSDSPDPHVPHPSGVYLLGDWLPQARMLSIDPTTSNQTKTGGFFGYMMTGGIASMSFNTVVPNAQARIVAGNGRPVFYFYFDQSRGSLSTAGQSSPWMAGAVTSPNEFSLVRFALKKGRREAKIGKFNIGGAKAGVMDEDRIPFAYEQISPGVFQVRPSAELRPGEYGFIYSISTGGGGMGMAGMGAQTSKIFDFSVPGPPVVARRAK
jgi:hypothetical protein